LGGSEGSGTPVELPSGRPVCSDAAAAACAWPCSSCDSAVAAYRLPRASSASALTSVSTASYSTNASPVLRLIRYTSPFGSVPAYRKSPLSAIRLNRLFSVVSSSTLFDPSGLISYSFPVGPVAAYTFPSAVVRTAQTYCTPSTLKSSVGFCPATGLSSWRIRPASPPVPINSRFCLSNASEKM
jgi:hypothetical protein